MLICAKHNRIIVENDELNKILRKIIDNQRHCESSEREDIDE